MTQTEELQQRVAELEQELATLKKAKKQVNIHLGSLVPAMNITTLSLSPDPEPIPSQVISETLQREFLKILNSANHISANDGYAQKTPGEKHFESKSPKDKLKSVGLEPLTKRVIKLEKQLSKRQVNRLQALLDIYTYYYHTTKGLWCIDRDPREVDLDWIRENAYTIGSLSAPN